MRSNTAWIWSSDLRTAHSAAVFSSRMCGGAARRGARPTASAGAPRGCGTGARRSRARRSAAGCAPADRRCRRARPRSARSRPRPARRRCGARGRRRGCRGRARRRWRCRATRRPRPAAPSATPSRQTPSRRTPSRQTPSRQTPSRIDPFAEPVVDERGERGHRDLRRRRPRTRLVIVTPCAATSVSRPMMLLPLASLPSLMTLTSHRKPVGDLHELHGGARVHPQLVADAGRRVLPVTSSSGALPVGCRACRSARSRAGSSACRPL